MSAAIFNSGAVKILKDLLRFKSGNLITYNGQIDPTVTALDGLKGDLYVEASTGKLFKKQDFGLSTNWSELPDSDTLALLLSDYILLTEKGAANGVATLDNGGKVPSAQLPNSVMQYQGQYDASTDTPSLTDGTGSAGDVYEVTVAGTNDFGSGPISFNIGDWVVYNGAVWQKSINSNEVVSVNGLTGAVTLDSDDIGEGATNLYYTTARANLKANVELNNLGTTAINAHMNPDSGSTRDLGATGGFAWRRLYVNELRDNSDVVTINPTQSTLNGGGNETVFWNGSAFRILPNVVLQFMSSAFGFLSFKIADSQTTSTTYTLPTDGTNAQVLQTDGGGNLSWSDRANTALSNLGSTAVNAHVVPDSGSARDLGATGGFAWRRLYVNELRDNSDVVTINPTQSTLNGGGNETVFWNGSAFRILPNVVFQFMSSAFGFLSFKIDDSQTGSTTYTLPMDGTAGQLLQTDGGGNLSWTSAGTGTVTTVTSANADISVATPTSTPELTLNSGTGADQIVKRNSSAEIDAGTQKVINVVDPTAAQDAATKNYVDSKTTDAYYATVVSKTSGSVTANATVANWNAPTKNTGSAFNATTGEYTVPADGDYDAEVPSYLPTSGSMACVIQVNGSTFITGSAGIAGSTRGSTNILLPNLVAGDIVTVESDSSVTISELVFCIRRVVGS